MRKMTRSVVPVAASTLFSMFALPAAAFAQWELAPVRVTASAVARADSLDAAASRRTISTLRDFKKVARLHEESAQLRSAGDAKRFDCLQTAARLRYGANDRRRAVEDMEQAAQQAAARGDVVNAAGAYVDAAHVAAELRQGERAAEFVRAAQLLTQSPLLSDAQRTELRGRLPQRFQVAMLERP